MPHRFLPLATYRELPPDEMARRAREFADDLGRRRTVRDFADRAVPRSLIEDCLRAAGTAPSGANQQPWHFCIVSDPAVKRRIRAAAEAEERDFYERRAPQEWLDVLAPLGTDASKAFLEVAPWLIAVFIRRFERLPNGGKRKHYYTDESVGIATGLLVAALHHAGLVSLTHTPSPMKFLNDILGRPRDLERPFLLLVAGYPAADALVPDIGRKPLAEFTSFV
jgi:iodotyrosine deiodinase